MGPQAGRKVFTLQTLPAGDDGLATEAVGKVAGFSLHAGVVAKAHERKKLERLCRYISRPAVSARRLSLTTDGKVRYDVKGFTNVAGAWMRRSDELKTPYRDGTTHVIFEPLEYMAHIPVRHPSGDLRSCKSAILPICHCPARRPGSDATCQPDALPRCVRAQQQAPCIGHAGQTRQRQQSQSA